MGGVVGERGSGRRKAEEKGGWEEQQGRGRSSKSGEGREGEGGRSSNASFCKMPGLRCNIEVLHGHMCSIIKYLSVTNDEGPFMYYPR